MRTGIRISLCVGDRIEWGKLVGQARPDDKGYDKVILCSEIVTINGGAVTDVARRAAKGRDESLFLCVSAHQRTLDLEFSSRALRDEWWGLLRTWHELHAARDMPAGWTSALPRPPAHATPAPDRSAPARMVDTPSSLNTWTPPPDRTRGVPMFFSPSQSAEEEA